MDVDVDVNGTNGSPAAALRCPAQIPPDMACVPGATFRRGSADHAADERPVEPVFVQTFLMDLTEVTVAAHRECIAARACRRPMPFRNYMRDTQPIVAVSWQDAVDFCTRAGKRLPTEAEWEHAASGPGPEPTTFPWGNDEGADQGCEHAIVETSAGKGCGTGITAPVRSRAPGHYGLYDMGGNVWEWVADWYSPCYRGCENECGDACAGDDPRGPCAGAASCPRRLLRVVRGGAWWWPIERARAQSRRGAPPANTAGPHRFGFRCARDVAPGPP